MQIRRVVMGTDPTGAVRVLDDDLIDPTTAQLLSGVEIHRVWELDEATIPVRDPETGAGKATFFPGPPGVRFGFLTIPPGIDYVPDAGLDPQQAVAEIEACLPGAAASFSFPEQPGVHATSTVDYIVAVSGHGIMRVDDIEVRLNHGDCLVQNGNPHGWFNDGDEPFVVAFALCGARQTA